MNLFKLIYTVTVDALFPLSKEEQAVLSMHPKTAWKTLPRAKNFSTKEACSFFSYQDERMRKLVWALKYKKSKEAARIGGYSLFRILRTYSTVTGTILVIPIPITRQRRRERGFNQCELLMDEIERLSTQSNLSSELHFNRDLLIRTRHKPRQTLKNREERLLSAHELFKATKKADEAQTHQLVIVIDDVITTGSTMKEAVEALRTAGFTKAFGLSLAH